LKPSAKENNRKPNYSTLTAKTKRGKDYSTPAPAGFKAFVAKNQQTFGQLAAVKPALVIPKIPYVPMPKRVASAFPELDEWHTKNHAQLEAWRIQTNVAIFGSIPPA